MRPSSAPGAQRSDSLRFGVLGPFEATWAGTPLSLGGVKQQAVLALLVLEANRVVSVDRLLQWVWDDEADSRRHATLQVYVSNLRRTLAPASEGLGRSLIVTQRPGYVLRLDEDQSDLLRFESLCRRGSTARTAGRPGEAVDALREAHGLWRGQLLDGIPVDPAIAPDVSRLPILREALLEQVAEAELGAGNHRPFLSELASWVREHPLDERLRGHLMIALYRCGRQADALATYREVRERLLEELGIDPSPELRDLQTRILNQDPSLDGPEASNEGDVVSTALRSSVTVSPAHLEMDGELIALDRPVLTIGRRPDCGLVLDDPGVSRRHAEIRRLGTGHRLFDLGSSNGTIVNEGAVSEHTLADGDEIRLGDVRIVFRA